MEISFSAYEYHQDEIFHKADYRFFGSCDKGWKIFKNEKLVESLGPGYVLLKSLYCGICSTDIARAKLPFPLPQITGHEVIGLHQGKPVAVDINASHQSRGMKNYDCYYCQQAMGLHCPNRLTLGIDRLPGGFSPYILAPQNALFSLPENIDPKLMVVIEPFAAALQAVESMPIETGLQIAIVGPKRLGLLLILALKLYREKTKKQFTISAVIRHSALAENCCLFGADEVLKISELKNREFDIVYDTSGSVSGFQLSMALAKSALHVKSTHGLEVGGFAQLTQLVIDELSLFPLLDTKYRHLIHCLQDKNKRHLLLDSHLPKSLKQWIEEHYKDKILTFCDLNKITADEMKLLLPKEGFRRFDIALVLSMEQVNKVIAFPGVGNLLRARGDVHWYGGVSARSQVWFEFFEKYLILCSSRCGDFSRAINLIEQDIALFSHAIPKYISGCFEVEQLNKAFKQAREEVASIKLIIKH